MDWKTLYKHAVDSGFSDCFCVSTASFDEWNSFPKDTRWASLEPDITRIYPWAKRIIVLIRSYRPYKRTDSCTVTIDAYYPASQSAYTDAGNVAGFLRDNGIKAEHTQNIPCKPALMRTGRARYGTNGITSIDGFGTYYIIQTIATEAEFPLTDDDQAPNAISDMCAGCDKCIKACPTGAISREGRIDPDRCLRGYSYSEILPTEKRLNISGSLFGCGICQSVCPRNNGAETAVIPPEVSDVLDIKKLLAGDTGRLPVIIGKNYTVKNRIIARTILIAVKMHRTDLIPDIEKLTCHASPLIREYALWALEMLNENKSDQI